MQPNHPQNLNEWSRKMEGARDMMQVLIQCHELGTIKIQFDKGKVYNDAILRLLSSDLHAIETILLNRFDKIGYRNHKRDKSGKLTYCEAYIINT